MQKLHRSMQPSCTFTYARCRRPKPQMPVGTSVTPNRPSRSGSSRLSVTTSVTFGSARDFLRRPRRVAAHHDDLRAPGSRRASRRIICRLFESPSPVTVQVLTMHRSAALLLGRILVADPEQPLAHELRFVLVDLAAERDGVQLHAFNFLYDARLDASTSSPCCPSQLVPAVGVDLVALQLGVLLGRREHDRLARRRRPPWRSCWHCFASCGRTARGASSRRTRTCGRRCPTGCTLYRGCRALLALGLACFLGSTTTTVVAPSGPRRQRLLASPSHTCESSRTDACGGASRCTAIILDGLPTAKRTARATRIVNDVLDHTSTSHRQPFDADLAELLRIPSVSADSRHAADVRRAAEWVVAQLRELGLDDRARSKRPATRSSYAESPPVPGKPGRAGLRPLRRAAARSARRVDHAAVRADGPRRQRLRPRRDRRQGADAHARQERRGLAQAAAGKLPLQVKFLIEGEEEVGSAHLEPFVAAERRAAGLRLRRDQRHAASSPPACRRSPTACAASPTSSCKLTGPKQDLHSGMFGGGVANPANALVADARRR